MNLKRFSRFSFQAPLKLKEFSENLTSNLDLEVRVTKTRPSYRVQCCVSTPGGVITLPHQHLELKDKNWTFKNLKLTEMTL